MQKLLVIKNNYLYLQSNNNLICPGSFQENDMKFKIDDNLNVIVAAMSKPTYPERVSIDLAKFFVSAKLLKTQNEYNCVPVMQALGPQYVIDICETLKKFLGVDTIQTQVFDAFCKLIIIEDWFCPYCAIEMKLTDTDGHEINDGDYYTPNSYEIDKYVYTCPNCGETLITKEEL